MTDATGFNPWVDDATHDLLTAINAGTSLADAMADLTINHAARLHKLGDVRVLALDPCPRCGGRILASTTEARCTTGCDYSYQRHGVTP